MDPGPGRTDAVPLRVLGVVQERVARAQDRPPNAVALNVPRSTLANLETGSGKPTLSVLARVAGALQVSIEELFSAPRAMGRVIPAAEIPRVRRGPGQAGRVRPSGSRVNVGASIPRTAP